MHFHDTCLSPDLEVHNLTSRGVSLMKSLPAAPDGNLKMFNVFLLILFNVLDGLLSIFNDFLICVYICLTDCC